jgi:hypothetical protein
VTLAGSAQPSTDSALDEAMADSVSADSEAGPSSVSPAPQTPTVTDGPPPPLTSEPYVIHSPYEEPRIFMFPASDPGFAFVLGLDDGEIRRQAAEAGYQPSPFSKTLVDLAELGVLAPELPDLSSQGSLEVNTFSGTFQPFGSPDGDSDLDFTSNEAGPSRVKMEDFQMEEREGPRTTSRFDFARSGSSAASRGQSPFALRDRGGMMERARDRDRDRQAGEPWVIGSGSRGFGFHDGGSGMGSLSNYPVTEGSGGASAWAPGTGDSPYMPSRRDHMQGYGGSKGLRLDREAPIRSNTFFTPSSPIHSRHAFPLTSQFPLALSLASRPSLAARRELSSALRSPSFTAYPTAASTSSCIWRGRGWQRIPGVSSTENSIPYPSWISW